MMLSRTQLTQPVALTRWTVPRVAWGSVHARPHAPTPLQASSAAEKKEQKAPLRFQYEPAHTTRLSFRTWHQRRQQCAPPLTRPEVDVLVEGEPLGGQLSRCTCALGLHECFLLLVVQQTTWDAGGGSCSRERSLVERQA